MLALLPEYAGIDDPVADLRAACRAAVGWLGDDVTVRASSSQGERVAAHLLARRAPRPGRAPSVAARRQRLRVPHREGPGHLDERSFGFDDGVHAWLSGHGPAPDPVLARDLWADVDALLAFDPGFAEPEVLYDDDPYGVRYWVLAWDL